MILGAGEAYRRWASAYDRETAVTILENPLARTLTPPLAGRTILDAACGTGRRMPARGVCRAVGVDLVPAMLQSRTRPDPRLIAGDLRALPVPTARFDIVWCRLALGHLSSLAAPYGELARVARAGATVVVTDIHPAAIAAGHRRTFRDHAGTTHQIEHYVHTAADHASAATTVGLTVTAERVAKVGPRVRALYASANRLGWYERDTDLPLVLALQYMR